MVIKDQMDGQRVLGELARKRRQRAQSSQSRAATRDRATEMLLGFSNLHVRHHAVATDRELHLHPARRSLILRPVALDQIDHLGQIRWGSRNSRSPSSRSFQPRSPPAGRVSPPNGIGAPPVSARASPGLHLRARWSAFARTTCRPACSIVFGGVFGSRLRLRLRRHHFRRLRRRRRHRRSASRSAGDCPARARPAIGVSPPVSGPLPLLSVIIIGVTSLSRDDDRQLAGHEDERRDQHRVRQQRDQDHAADAIRFLRSLEENVADGFVHALPA